MTRSFGMVSLLAAASILWGTPGRADSVNPSKDAFIDTAAADQNNGGSTQLFVSKSAGAGDHEAFVKFDLSTLPAGATIAHATLRLFVNTLQTTGPIDATLLDIHQVLVDWTEETLTAGTAPAVDSSALTIVAITAAPLDYLSVEIPVSTVQGWVTAPDDNFGLAILPDPGAADFTVAFDSKENIATSHPPELEVVLAPDIAPGAIGAPELAADAVSSATVLDNSLTGADIADDSLTAADIGPGAIGASELADDAVTSPKVTDESLTAADIADILISPASGNIAIGTALFSNTTGGSNTAIGTLALFYNTTGSGAGALSSNTTGSSNTASGVSALFRNTTGNFNTATGSSALFNNTTGGQNTASGNSALSSNTTGSLNTASGVNALLRNTTGRSNTASGLGALFSNTTGSS